MGDENMTGKEIVNLICELKKRGFTSDDIIDVILMIESQDPKASIESILNLKK